MSARRRVSLSTACLLATVAAPLVLPTPAGASVAAPYDTGRTGRVSLSSSEAAAGGSGPLSLSRNGRYVAFHSGTVLTPGDTNGSGEDIFVRDRSTGTTTLVSRDENGRQGDTNDDDCNDGVCRFPGSSELSPDGRVLVFTLSAGASERTTVHVRDLQAGTTRPLTGSTAGVGLGGITSSGRYAVATDISSSGGGEFVILYDTAAGTGRIVAREVSDLGRPDLSDDARYITYSAARRVAGEYRSRVHVQDLDAGTERVASVATGGGLENGRSTSAVLSANGRFVAFSSTSSNLVAGDTNGKSDVFVRDLVAGFTRRLSVSDSGGQSNGNSFASSISDDGRYVAFTSTAGGLVAGDTNGKVDAFVRDRVGNRTRRVSVSSSGAQADASTDAAAISGDGLHVAFSSSSALVPNDANGRTDVFVRDAEPFR